MKNFYALIIISLTVPGISIAQDHNPVKLSNKINSSADEGYPLLSQDGNKIYFSRTFHKDNQGGEEGGQDAWYSEYNGKRWVKPTNALTTINDEYNNVISGWTFSGDTMFIQGSYDSKFKLKAGLSYSIKTSTGWSFPEEVKIKGLLIKGQFYGIYVHPSTKYILYSMNSTKTLGEEDLYVSIQNAKGSYDKPIHLGSVINTSGYEMSPYLSFDTKTLYFASNGHGGLGDVDIFKTTRLDDTWQNWSAPENLGAPINSESFDAFFTIGTTGDAFLASNRKADFADLYWIKNYEKPYVPGQTTSEPLVVEATDDSSQIVEEVNKTSVEPIEEVAEEVAEVVEKVKVQEPVVTQKVDPITEEVAEEVKKTEVIEKVDAPEKLTDQFNNMVFFGYNSWELDQGAKNAIKNDVVANLNGKKPNKVLVHGHADNVGTALNNQKVSTYRAKAVRDYLISLGIDKGIILIQGFGELKPKADNSTEEGRAKNRRVEIMVK